jgi:hypothetical protein
MEKVWEAELVDMQLPVSATSGLLRSVIVTLLSVDVWTRRTMSALHVRCNSIHLTFARVLITDPLEVSDKGTPFDKTRRKKYREGADWILLKNTVFLDITPCSPLKVSPRFGRICHLHFQGRDVG